MSTVAKVFIILNLFLTFAYLFMVASLLAQKNDYKAKYLEDKREFQEKLQVKDAEIVTAKDEVQKIREKCDVLVASVHLAQADLRVKESRLRIIKEQEDKVKGKIPNLEKSRDQLKSQSSEKERDNKDLENKKGDLEGVLSEVEEEKEKALSERDEVKSQLEKNYQYITELSEQLNATHEELAKMSVQFQSSELGLEELRFITGKRIQAQVVSVSPATGQITLNVGKKDEVQEKDQFIVYRSGSYVGQVEIETVFEAMSAGRILTNALAQGAQIQEGDSATTRLD
jgi:chromosome segregation ATPase